MTHKVHIFLDGNLRSCRIMQHIPQLHDTVRFSPDTYAKVTEVIFCLDEEESVGQRVNIRTETINES